MLQDVRYSLRQLIRNPGFALTAVISLALGIGATTAVFSVIYAALINPYPFRAADRIVRLSVQRNSGPADPTSVDLNGAQIQQLRQVPAVESVLAMGFQALTLTGHDFPENVLAVNLIANGFTDLGLPPILGRGIGPSDAIEGQDPQPVVVLTYEFWQKHFFASPEVLGKSLQLDHRNYVIVGVAAPRFKWYSADVYLPLKLTGDPQRTFVIDIYLKPGVTYQAANAALEPLLQQLAREAPKQFPEHFKVRVGGLNEWVERSISGTLFLLLGAVGLLLAVGCGNVSILLLARGAARQHELAVRVAVGANRGRLVRQLLTEALLLAAAGVVLGVVLSFGILAGIQAVLPRFAFAPEVVIRINLPVLFFSGAVALATGILFGLWPALQVSRTQVAQMIQSTARRVAGSVHGRRTHNVLIAGQIALTLLLLAGAGSAMAGFVRLLHTPLGYDPHGAVSLAIPLRDNSFTTWPARAAYFEQLRAKVAETPGVIMAAVSGNATPPRSGSNSRFEILGQPSGDDRTASLNLASPEYFALLRIPLLEGRLWNAGETRAGTRLAVINRAFAQRYFPNGDAFAHSLKVGGLQDRPPFFLTAPAVSDAWLPIVGIVGDARNDGLENPIKPAIFLPYTFGMGMGTQILARSQAPPLTLLNAMRAQLAKVNPDQQIFNHAEDLETWITDQPQWQQEHLAAWIFGVFAGLALLLAAVGLYSVVSYTVAQRTGEFGIRMALGAQRGHVLRIVFGSTVASVGTGIAAGLMLTLVMNTMLAQWTKGNSRDPIVLIAGALLLALVSAIASAIPAFRACRADPMTALRSE